MPPRPCLTRECRALIARGSYCSTCTTAREQARDTARGTAAARGYGSAHQARRTRLLQSAYYTPCPQCGELMLPEQKLDAGHSTPLALDSNSVADRIEHASCNRRAGGRIRRRTTRDPRPDDGNSLPTIA
jgi:hypothetical protein